MTPRSFLRAGFAVVLWLAAASAAPTPTPSLPDFAGWHKIGSVHPDASSLPAAQPAWLAEFGLQSIERATYQHEERRLQVEAFLFRDASGAFGAFTFLAPANYYPFDVKRSYAGGLAGDNHIIFYRGPWLVRADVGVVTAMTTSEIRELVANLPAVPGAQELLPTLPLYLPKPHYENQSLRYAEGPRAAAAAESWLPVSDLGFEQGAEVVTAQYDIASPAAQMMVISYPTPQIAMERMERFAASARRTVPPAFLLRRSGPLLALLRGANGGEARALLGAVNYHADITWNEPTPVGLEGLPHLILGIFALVGILIALAVGVGFATGWSRILLQRLFPRKFARSEAGNQIIRLGLGRW